MKTKPTLYIVCKYNDNGDEIDREIFQIHQSSLSELIKKYPGKEYDIYRGRHTKCGKVVLLDCLVSLGLSYITSK